MKLSSSHAEQSSASSKCSSTQRSDYARMLGVLHTQSFPLGCSRRVLFAFLTKISIGYFFLLTLPKGASTAVEAGPVLRAVESAGSVPPKYRLDWLQHRCKECSLQHRCEEHSLAASWT